MHTRISHAYTTKMGQLLLLIHNGHVHYADGHCDLVTKEKTAVNNEIMASTLQRVDCGTQHSQQNKTTTRRMTPQKIKKNMSIKYDKNNSPVTILST